MARKIPDLSAASSALWAGVKLPLFMLWLLPCVGVCALLDRFSPKHKPWIIRLCYRGLLFILGVRVRVEGALAHRRPLLLITNHSSYLDVMILGALAAPRFTPKAEVAAWPLIGYICRITGCVFIDRRMHKTPENQKAIHTALEEGALLSLFPEGTTGDGKHLLPFRSSYFALAGRKFGGEPLVLQAAAIAYRRIRNLPIDHSQRPKIAWYGDMELMPHLFGLLRLGSIEARITFCDPLTPGPDADRKALAAACRTEIIARLEQADG